MQEPALGTHTEAIAMLCRSHIKDSCTSYLREKCNDGLCCYVLYGLLHCTKFARTSLWGGKTVGISLEPWVKEPCYFDFLCLIRVSYLNPGI
jgi:hypothetical protein